MFEAELTRFHQAVGKAERILITATEREDGDSIAAELAVKYILEKAFPDTLRHIHVINMNPCPARFRFLHDASSILNYGEQPFDRYDMGIVVDCGIDRSGPVKELFAGSPYRVKIDHHSFGNEGDYDLEICTREVAATTEILACFLDHPSWEIHLDPILAEYIYVGISSDTGSFRYDLTRPTTHLLAARLLGSGFDFTRTADRLHLARTYSMKKLLGLVLDRMKRARHGLYLYSVLTPEMITRAEASEDDIPDIIDGLCFVEGVEVSMLFVEEQPDEIRISFRSKGGINVGQFARSVAETGGGHPRASGCHLSGKLDHCISLICAKMDQELVKMNLLSSADC